jgi:hypothetical protein
MTNSNILDKAIEAIIVLNAALTNIRLYPPSSAMITNSVDSSFTILNTIFEQDDSIVFAESEKNLIIAGQALNEKEQKKPQVQAFTQLMQNLGIKSIAFEKGLEKDEILGFLEVASKKPDDLRKQGGIQSLLSAKGVKNILLDQKLYVAMDKDQRIVSAEDAKNTGQPDSEEEPTAEKDRRASEDRRQKDDLDYLAKGGVERRKQERRKELLIHIKSSITNLLKGDDKPFFDKQVMQSLAPTVLNMINNGKDTDAEVLTNRMGEGLLNKDEKIRSTAATVLAKIIIKLLSDKRMDDAVKVSKKYIEWIKFEIMTPPA